MGPHPAWVEDKEGRLPSVGDTYIVLNTPDEFGHVGIFLRVPKSGNGLWVTVDGGQGSKPEQFAFIIGRWGVMADHLPPDGYVEGVAKKGTKPYKHLKPEPGGPPYIASNSAGSNHGEQPGVDPPKLDDDVDGMLRWMKFWKSPASGRTSNPRRLHGFVDIDNLEVMTFDVDGKGRNTDHIKACKKLLVKVENVVKATLAGGVMTTVTT